MPHSSPVTFHAKFVTRDINRPSRFAPVPSMVRGFVFMVRPSTERFSSVKKLSENNFCSRNSQALIFFLALEANAHARQTSPTLSEFYSIVRFVDQGFDRVQQKQHGVGNRSGNQTHFGFDAFTKFFQISVPGCTGYPPPLLS